MTIENEAENEAAIMLAAVLVTGLASLLVWEEREDRIQTVRNPNSQARYTLEGIWLDESTYLANRNDFARSLSNL